jgi:3-oxoacyl-[acyl-carrier-protein] synthase II
MQLKRVVVTGLGAVTPLGNTAHEYWKNLVAGVSGAGPITRFDASKFRTRFACEVKGFDPGNFLDRKEARKMDPFVHYAIASTDEAIADSKIKEGGVDLNRVGVIWGSGIGGLLTFQEEVLNFGSGDGTPRFNPFFIPKMIVDSSAGLISMRNGFRGPNYCTVSACASSNNALIDAFTYLRTGRIKVCITGGSEAAVTIAGVGGFNALKAMSERNDEPEKASRPYDKDRDGFVLGEGSCAIVLEEYEHAVQRGAKIYCEVVGSGMSSDAYHITAPHPEGVGFVLMLEDALRDAEIEPSAIDYINTHGTSTPLGDPLELNAIYEVFGESAYKMNISSTKSMHGHLLGAAGAIEAAACIKAIENQMVPPTINLENLDETIDPRFNLTPNQAQKREIRYAMSNGFGFGGHNAAVIFKKMD